MFKLSAEMSLLLFLQAPTPSPAVVNIPERMPALLSLIYLGGLLVVVILLLISLFRNRRRGVSVAAAIPEDLPPEVKRRLGSTSTNRGLRALRWIFVLIAISVFAFHVYWTHYAP